GRRTCASTSSRSRATAESVARRSRRPLLKAMQPFAGLSSLMIDEMIMLIALLLAADLTTPKALFDRLLALQGEWVGHSTKGWTEHTRFRVIARGTALLETSDPEPGAPSPMATVFSLDQERVVLTHYCEAGNHPRLQATSIDAASAEFTFVDGTNLPSRDRGHMDRVRLRFLGPDRFTSRWTWYQDGKEGWMEEIEYRRVRK